MRVTVVGAGVAGLTAALALHRDDHDVTVVERAPELRATGFGLNLWSNATTLLDRLGVAVPGEPFDRMSFRAGGREQSVMAMPAVGVAHMNADRGAVVQALADCLPPEAIRFNTTVTATDDLLADGADLVVIADGAASRLRPDAARPQSPRKPWIIWQAVLDDGGDLLAPGLGAAVVGRDRFVGVWRHPQGGLCWFLEAPRLDDDLRADELLTRLAGDDDPLVRAAAAATPAARLGQWRARDRWPSAIVGDRVAVIGDAAHPMLPCIGQGACLSVEDGVVLAAAVRHGPVMEGLLRYRAQRLRRMRSRVVLARIACELRRPTPVAAAIASTPLGRPFATVSGVVLRRLARLPATVSAGVGG